ncbi:MAG: ABC transporter permease [Clostridium sp.]
MKPLNPLIYIRENLKKVVPIFVSVVLGFFLIYFFGALLFTGFIIFDADIAAKEVVKLYPSSEIGISMEGIELLEKNENVEKVIPFSDSEVRFSYKAIMGSTVVSVIRLFPEDINEFLSKNNLTLEGKLPEKNKAEIIIPEKIAMQLKLKIGDVIEKDKNSNIKTDKIYKIVGIIKGEKQIPLTADGLVGEYNSLKSMGAMFYLKDGNNTEINEEMKSYGRIVDYNGLQIEVGKMCQSIYMIYYAVVILMIGVISFSLNNLNLIHLENRIDELKVLNYIGYTKGYLIKKVIKENLIVIIAGSLVGLILALTVISLCNILIWEQQGKASVYFDNVPAMVSFITPVIIGGLSLMSTIKRIKKIGI